MSDRDNIPNLSAVAAKPREDLVETAKLILKMAEAGEIMSLCYATLDREGVGTAGYAGVQNTAEMLSLIGSADVMKGRLRQAFWQDAIA